MSGLPGYLAWCAAGLVLCAALLLLRRPAARLLRLILRSGLGLAVLPGRRPGMHGRKAKPSHQNANQHAHGHNAAVICFQRVPGGLFPLFWLPHF